MVHRLSKPDAAVVAVALALALVSAAEEAMTRIVITGGPRTGKTTLAELIGADHPGFPVRHTDDLIEQCKHLGKDAWSEASRIVTKWLDEPGPWIIEGVAVTRALRKWKEAYPGEPPPADRVIFCTTPHTERTPRQIGMAKGVDTVHRNDVVPWLEEHGIATEYR